MAISGDAKENYIALQQSTGESYEHMADRLLHPNTMRALDEAGQHGNVELAAWLRTQKDDPDAIERGQVSGPEAEAARQRQAAGQPTESAPKGRTTPTGGKQNG